IDEAKKNIETKKQLERRESEGFAKALETNRSIAEALKKEFLDKGKRARNQYPLRKEYRQEFELLCNAQGFDIHRDSAGIYQDLFVQKLWKAIIWQRPLRSQKGNIGRCTLENDKPRCPVSHPLFEIFRALQFINTIKTVREENNETIKEELPLHIREKLYYDFFLKKDKNVKFAEIKKFLDKQFKHSIKYNYNYKDDHSASTMPVCKGLIDVFGTPVFEQIKELYKYNIGNAPKIIKEKYSVFDLWHALYSFDEAYLKKFSVQKLKIADEITSKGKNYNPFVEIRKNITSAYSDLSVKAICKIIPFLQEGFLYNEAVLLAKMPELINGKWDVKKEKIYEAIQIANGNYNWEKMVIAITNSLIDRWKGLQHDEKFAYKDVSYILQPDDVDDITHACLKHFGETTWNSKSSEIKNKIINEVKDQYQKFFSNSKRAFRETFTLDKILNDELNKLEIHLKGELYHHSKRENLYLKKTGTKPDGTPNLPLDKKTGKEILPTPLIDSIKNPMFNKALSVLRKLLNELIINGDIDNDTEIMIEVARELNDNNKRIAIERYQRERENQKEKYKEFLKEFKEKENISINVDENISLFEMWNEQNFSKVQDDKGNSRLVRELILKEKDSLKRYELWMEQKGQCMYTGKMIGLKQLFSNEVDIEHTIPRSILPDNTLSNQTVCYAWYNRDRKKKQFPTSCDNYEENVDDWGTAIKPRLKEWIKIRDHYEIEYEKHKKHKPGEDEAGKNDRIQKKHYYKMHFDYWNDKIERFTCTEIKESWIRRQLTDTQMISKYAREFLSIYFNNVKVQKGTVTADFRKIFSIQEEDEIKNRNKHTHHAIDAAVLTLIPTNSSYRERLLKTMYEWQEQKKGQFTTTPFANYNSQQLIQNIDNSVLVVNYVTDKILKRTYKINRNRGRIIFLPNIKNLPEPLKDNHQIKNVVERANKIPKIACGDSIRTSLYKQTFVAKLRDVERENGKPLRNDDGTWKFKTGADEFFYAERVSINDAKKYIKDIVDPTIQKLVSEQKNNPIVKDHQGNIIRHVRVRTNAGKIVKQRLNYQSKNEYKNQYYAASGELPYAAFLQRINDGKIERLLIPISSAELAKTYKTNRIFNLDKFIELNYPDFVYYPDKKLLKIGQKIFVLKNDDEYEKRNDLNFQVKRLYKITQFHYTGNKIILQYHLESRTKVEIDKSIKESKNSILKPYEQKLNIPVIMPDESISNIADRKKEYEKRLYDFDARIENVRYYSSEDFAKKLKSQIEEFKTESSEINDKNPAPILGLSRSNWTFLLEGEDFNISMSGILTFK
ncbi:MAG: hypothetical protein GTN67_07145, partial [Hydrotalea flava]|nr:hypothetical protein [Hydrotalea flava]NIM38024.1 hypothetical protein [Hydrotalea flava]NIN03198.1 hypothetical protein [Hydrotalea flava]NIN14888.1 hypothetical protein [Hydrotalea flava]NIO93950.1 hypothetical protein [Hydrotalea flava]